MFLAMCQILYAFAPAYAADVVPVLVRGMFEPLSRPIDGGRTFRGRPILGSHKTWRGLITGTVAGMAVFEVQALADDLGFLRELALIQYSDHPVLSGFLIS